MRGWTARRQEIESQQTSPRNHDGLIWDYDLARHNENELRRAQNEMVEAYMAAGDWDALGESDNTPAAEMVPCSCGHTVPRSDVMNASLGTSCPDCYDRMSA